MLNNRYRILKPLGQGGFGKTFLSIDEKDLQGDATPKLCVIKQFFVESQNIYSYQKGSELFHQESLRLAELGKHPQIPQLLDTFEQDGNQYLVQEWVDGQTLEQELSETGAFSEADIWQLLGDLLPVLQFVHVHQIIHRDIKPANIIRRRSLTDTLRDAYGKAQRQFVLVDFGAAKYDTGNWQHTGTLIGSAEYASPEQVRGKAVFASDLYSLGVTCLHLLTQMSPFELYDCSENTWVWRSHLVEPISPSLEKILCKLVQPATKLRYHFAAEALIDLNDSSGGVVTTNIDDDFETPFFVLSRQQNLPTSVTAIADNSVTSVTVFDPATQDWYYFPAKTEGGELVRKVAAFLGPRLTAAAATPPVRETKPTAVDRKATHKLKKMHQIIVTAIAFTIACLALVVESNSIPTNLKVEISRNFQQFMNIGQNEKLLH
ncbi:MAG: serine/threonine-protein kinase [Aulosira sp. DedQUE10]|nr:serine/threonine-protein kinase [Aulosira sp. DedQUE10]